MIGIPKTGRGPVKLNRIAASAASDCYRAGISHEARAILAVVSSRSGCRRVQGEVAAALADFAAVSPRWYPALPAARRTGDLGVLKRAFTGTSPVHMEVTRL